MEDYKIKILSILPSIEFYGKERSNIEIYRILAMSTKVDLQIIINNRASNKIRVNTSGFSVNEMLFPSRSYSLFRYTRYLYEVFISNIILSFFIIKIKPDIIFLNTETSLYDFVFPLFFLRRNKIIYRIGDAPAYSHLSGHKFNSFIWKKIACKKVYRFISISKYIKNELESSGRISMNDCIIYNAIPRRARNTKLKLSKKKEQSKICFGYLGQIIEEKGVKLLLQASIEMLNSHHDIDIYFAGGLDYDKSFSSKLLTEKESTQYKSNIVFLGEIENIDDFFEQIDVLCVPSICQEALGNVILEAKQHHTPCIVFPNGGMPEIIKHKENGYICDQSTVKSLKEAISYYIDNPILIKEHGKNAFNSISELKIDNLSYQNEWLYVFDII